MRTTIFHIQGGQWGDHIEPNLWEVARDKHVGGPTGRYAGESSNLQLERLNINYMEVEKLIDLELNTAERRKAENHYYLQGGRPSCIGKLQKKEWTRWRSKVMKQRIT